MLFFSDIDINAYQALKYPKMTLPTLPRWREFFWPIYNFELPKFLPIALLMFCTLFNQNILRVLKDSIIIPEIGAEVTSFAKLYAVTPVAALFVVIYARMTNYWSLQKIYYVLLSFFLISFFVFAFILYPRADLIHLDPAKTAAIIYEYPGLKWYVALVGNWGYVFFYVLSELWPSIFYGLLFWQIANQLTSTVEAKRFYPAFSLIGNSSLVLVGLFMMHIASSRSIINSYFASGEQKVVLVQTAIVAVLIVGILSAMCISAICRIRKASGQELGASLELNTKLSLLESFRYISSSRYLWLLLICSAAFGLTMNLVETVWKAQVKEFYPTVNLYAEANSWYILWTGVIIMIMTIVGSNLTRRYSWLATALVTPLVVMITGTIFFILVITERSMVSCYEYFNFVSPLYLAVTVGAVQNIIAKGTKYSMWDTSREMLYIPLDDELKTKGKAAVDVVSSKVGKSLSSLIQAVLFTLLPNTTWSLVSMIFIVIFVLVCLAWIYSVGRIYDKYKRLVS